MIPSQDNSPLHAAINAKLAEVAKSSPSIPPWHEAWLELGPQSSPEDRLKVYQAIRDADSVPEEAGFFLVAWQIDAIACECAETELREMEDRLHELEAEHESEAVVESSAGQSPSEYTKFLEKYYAAWDELFTRTLREFGETEIADRFQNDQEQFQQIDEAGRQFFHGPLAPDWLEDLIEAVAGCMEVDEPMGSLGYRWHDEDGDFWEIDLYPTPIELVGGAVDGAIVDPGYSLDLAALQEVFERIDALYWNTHGYHGSEPPFVSLEGIYEGREVYLRVLSAAPDGEEPGMKFQVNR
jgi:hypothetical protein